MNTFTLFSLTILVLLFGGISPHSKADDEQVPYLKSEFSIPEKYQSLIVNYPLTWQRMSGYEYSALHWKQFVVVYTNGLDNTYLNNHYEFMRVYEDDLDPEEDEINYKEYPVGTVILKESFNNINARPADPLLLSGMVKREPGYDPDYGDWEYFQSTKTGSLLSSGNSKNAAIQNTCINCHMNIENQDFVFATHYTVRPH